MAYHTTDKDDNIKSLPLFADINVRTLTLSRIRKEFFPNSIRADRPYCYVMHSLRRHAIERVGPAERRLR